jgi:hypothetical protein
LPIREERAALIASEPDKFFWPLPSDMRYQWVRCWLANHGAVVSPMIMPAMIGSMPD